MSLGARLKATRRAANITQEELSKLARCSNSYISNMENGHIESPKHKRIIEGLCEALNVPKSYLFEGKPMILKSIPEAQRGQTDIGDKSRAICDEILESVGMEATATPPIKKESVINRYELIVDPRSDKFSDEVQVLLNNGYQCRGDIFMDKQGWFCQLMVRYSDCRDG
tara:strand:+ start:910 stop:1416 length:507 start_codon:yes stop_codon:yes gene_type:complete